jgi:hypothetical protein
MEHYQKTMTCAVCEREIILDIHAFGVSHETISAATCKECAIKVDGNILKDGEVEQIT